MALKAPKIALDGVRRLEPDESTAESVASGPGGPRLGSTSPRPERAARRQTSNASLTTSSFDMAENAAQLRGKRQESIRRASVSRAPSGSEDKDGSFDSAMRPLPPVRLAHKVRAYTMGDGNESQGIITSMATTLKGDLLMWGDRSGRIFLLDREEGVASRAGPFVALTKQQAYTPFVDPLHSVDVSPAITASAFFPPVGPTTHFVTCNERIPKLWKVTQAPTTLAPPFKATDLIGTKSVGPLTTADPSVMCTEIAKYNMDHEYNVNTALPAPDGQHFITVDDLTVRLWATEVTHMSMDIASIRPPEGEEVKESFTVAATSVRDPTLVMCCTTAGFVRVLDTRCGLRLSADNDLAGAALVLRNPHRGHDGDYSQVSSSLLGCCASPCGNYIVGRDFLTVPMWDVRMASGATPGDGAGPGAGGSAAREDEVRSLVRRWPVHPDMQRHLDDVYQAQMLFDRTPISLVDDGRRWVTGAFGGRIVSAALGDEAATTSPEQLLADQAWQPKVGGGDDNASEGSAAESRDAWVHDESPYERGVGSMTVRRAEVYREVGAMGSEEVTASMGEAAQIEAGRTQIVACGATSDVFASIADVVHHVWLE